MNPLLNSNDSPNNSTQPSKAVNRQGVHVTRSHNTIDDSYFHYKTHRFGFYEPFFVMETVAGDRIPFSNSHNVRSLPFASPFLSSLKLNKDYFMCPMQAIMPNTWDYIFKAPSQGDDVPNDANCLMRIYSNDYQGEDPFWIDMIKKLGTSFSDKYFKFYLLLSAELICSQGSLLSMLGYKVNPLITCDELLGRQVTFDEFFDWCINDFIRRGGSFRFKLAVDNYENEYNANNTTIPQMLSLVRRYGSDVRWIDIIDFPTITNIQVTGYSPHDTWDFNENINLARVFAYQLSCAQYYVNPQIDFLYNAQLYRDNLLTLHKLCRQEYDFGDQGIDTFTYNGIQIPYDFTSKHYNDFLVYLIDDVFYQDEYLSKIPYFYDYLNAIFGLRETLRFGDYFTDSRTRPLAIGQDNVRVLSGGVSVIDITKSIVYQRFRNAVIKLGSNLGDYLRGIYGESPTPDYHVPKFIIHQDFDISGFEVANQTGTDQGTMVTNLQSGADTSVFDIESSMDSILVGISSFSVPQVYQQTKDRFFFHRDRYDMFNPMLQYIGDQVVYNQERTDLRPSHEVFGYQSRNNEYKQRLSIVSGGFAINLPAWSFVVDSIVNPSNYIAVANTQSPDFIRHFDFEFNRFFKQMSGYSLATSFHFIVVFNNKCVCNRPMEINPNIL